MAVVLNPQLNEMLAPIVSVRDAIHGEHAVKSKGFLYLPHPSQADKTSAEAHARYDTYKAGAEWDGFVEQTERSMLGKLRLSDAVIELPQRIDYLINDCDGDGLSLSGAINQAAKNVLEVKWHVLVADYNGLSDLELQDLSIEDIKRINPRAKIKQYTRENVLDWNYERVNGVMQLTYIMLQEVGSTFDQATRTRKDVKSYLVLTVDDIGYYQQKLVEVEGSLVEGERSYVTVGGKPLRWIPLQIVTDGEAITGEMPRQLGFLANLTQLAYSRYRVSADYKEALRTLPPTTFVYGMGEPEWEAFKEVNGRAYVATGAGAVNMLDGEARVEIVGANTQLEVYERYFADNKDKVQALGGIFKDSSASTKTATEAESDASEQNSVLVDLAGGLESAFKRIVLYCGMFEGLYSADDIEQNLGQVVIEITKDFTRTKLSVDEVKTVQELVFGGLMTVEQAIKALVQGGWLQGEAEDLLEELDEFSTAPVGQITDEVVSQ